MKRLPFLQLILSLLFVFSSAAGEKPYVLLISFDGFRWDYIDRGLSPNIEKLIGAGVSAVSLEPVFPPKTFPSHYSIVTGMHPQNHGMISNSFIDLNTGSRFTMGNREMVNDSRYYQGEAIWEILRRYGIVTASYFWPGSELDVDYRRPDYFHQYDHNRPYIDRIEGVIEWLGLPEERRPQFITLYFHEVDSQGHRFGPDGEETNRAIALLDSLFGVLIARLDDIGFTDKINIILVSDHGMTATTPERAIDLGKILEGFNVVYEGIGPVTMILPEDPDETDDIYERLREHKKNYRVYKKNRMPEYFHYSSHAFILPIIVIAEMGWSLIPDTGDPAALRYSAGGNHGYDNKHLDMHGIFYAMGPAFRAGYRTGTLRSIDVYPLICEIFGIKARDTIDGKLERMLYILKEQ